MLKKARKLILEMRENKEAVKPIYRKLRDNDEFEFYSDFILLSSIIVIFQQQKWEYTKDEVMEVIREIDKDFFDDKITTKDWILRGAV